MLAYSRQRAPETEGSRDRGLTSALYARSLVLIEPVFRFRRRKAKVLLALMTLLC